MTIKLKNHTIHNLSIDPKVIDAVYPGAKPMVATGIIVSGSDKLKPGDHTRTSLIHKIDGNLIHTNNSVYEVLSDDPDPVFPDDMGDAIMKIFY